MAKLESIYISGIRSFGISKEDAQAIKFHSPLTLFLGQNGCGKTTIIEALKCAITGDYPGGTGRLTGGAGFVSDPFLHHVASVVGQIRLNIRGPNNEKITVTRTLRSEKKNHGLKFSALDGTLRYLTPGKEEVSMSGRCGDLNEMMVQLLKVPKAILNNVIFCHQENSLWPLEDSSKLKIKFDEIFDSSKYTKCVETLRKIHKTRLDEINALKVSSNYMRDVKNEVERKKAVLAEKELQFEELDIEIASKQSVLEPIVKRVGEICGLETKMSALQSELAGKKMEKRNIEQQQKSIKENLKKEYAGSDSELQEELKAFNENKTKDEQRVAKLESRKEELIKLETAAAEAVQRKTAMLVQLKEKVAQYQDKIKERNGLINRMGETVKKTVSTTLETDVVDTINVLSAFEKDEKAALEKLVDTHEKINEKLQKKVDECSRKVIEIQQDIKSKRQYISNLEKETREINSQLHELSISDDQLKNFQNKLATVEADLKELNKSFDPEAAANAIEQEAKRIKEIEHELEDLDREYKILQKNSIAENELENIKSADLKREVDIHKIENKHYDNFDDLFGAEKMPNANVKVKVQEIQNTCNKQVTDLQNKISLKQKNFTVLDTKFAFQNKALSTLQSELQAGKGKLASFCGAMSYTEKCAEIKVRHNRLLKTRGELNAARVMYEKFIEDLSFKKCCPICSTDFDNKAAAVADIVDAIKDKIELVPIELKKNSKELEVVGELHEKSLYLKSDHDKISDLEEIAIPNLKAEIEDLKTRSDSDKREWESLKNDLKIPLKKVSVCGIVMGDAALVDQYRGDMEKSRVKIESLRSQMVTVKSQMNLQKCESKIDDVKTEISMARQNWDAQNKKLNQNRTRRQNLIDDKNKIKEQQLKLEKLMHGKPQLLDNIQENRKKQDGLEKEITASEATLIELQNNLDEAETDKSMTKEENKSTLTTARNDFTKTQNALSEIMKLQANVVSISNEKLDDRFNTVYEELKVLKTRQDDITSKKDEAMEKITEVRLLLGNQDSTERRLKDNIILREKCKEHAVIVIELKRLTDEIGTKNFEQISIEKNRLQKRYSEIDREIQQCRGKKDELRNTISDTKKDLETSGNKNAYNNYLHKVIELKTTEEANKNTKLYLEALDNAIVVLHRTRMKQINETIRQLWRQIYRGNDIDYIEIDSGDTEHIGASSRRMYNYKVMQMKNDTMIDMRGRCSAGQKVLACLIIRIALSETFSSDCGILALDEPTTNLDRENIESLSQSLAKIINSRQAQKNFQLLVITHDEDFIRTLRTVDAVKCYYKVSRSNKGTTVITTENI